MYGTSRRSDGETRSPTNAPTGNSNSSNGTSAIEAVRLCDLRAPVLDTSRRIPCQCVPWIFFFFWNLSVQAGLLRASRAFLACFFMCPLLALPWGKNVPWFFPFLLLSAAMRTSGYPVGTHSRTSNTFRLRGIAWHECVVRHHFVTPSRHCHVNVTHHLCTVSTAITMTAMTGIPDGPHTWEVSSETNLTFLVVIMTMFANFSAFIFFNRFYRARENDRWREVRVGSRWICIRTCQSCP